jgi:hypothetical protein
MATASVVNLSLWTGVVPVVLPWGEPTISSVGVASAGVAVPFVFYVIAMFMLIVPIWMNNFDSDKELQHTEQQQQQQHATTTMLTIQDAVYSSEEDGNGYSGYPRMRLVDYA